MRAPPGVSREAIREQNLYQALIGKRPLKDVIVGTMIPQLDIVPADQDLIGIEVEFVPLPDREKKLRTLVRALETP